MPKNKQRALLAHLVLERFAIDAGQDLEAEPAEVIADLICDLLHYCDLNGLVRSEIMANAFKHYWSEQCPF